MEYLHTMIRVSNLEESLNFFCHKLGLVETHRSESDKGRFTLVFLADPVHCAEAKKSKTPLIELTYNWPNEQGEVEQYTSGRNFGHLAFRVDHIYQTCKHLMSMGITINRPPRDGRMAFIKSPDGIAIELLQKGEALPPQEPWAKMENSGTW